MDHNHSTDRALDMGDVVSKFASFGWEPYEIDGHDVESIKSIKTTEGKPTFVLCNTIKGKGVSIMEGNREWHHKTPNAEQMQAMFAKMENN